MAWQELINRFNALSSREKLAVVLALILAVSLLPYSLIYAPAAKKLSAEKTELNAMLKEIEEMNSVASSISPPAEEKITLPASEDLAGMISAITKEANSANLEFISLTPEGMSQKDGYTEIKLKMELRLRFRALHDFLQGLEARQKLFMVKELKFETNDTVYPSGIAVLRATAYVRR